MLLIHKDDITYIVHQIIVEGSLNKTCTILREKDNNIEKANILYDILKAEKNMDAVIRNSYLKQIGELLSSSDISYETLEGQEASV